MSDLLIFGETGQLARALVNLADERGLSVAAIGRRRLDLADPALDLDSAIGAALDQDNLRWVVNASGYTAVDRAEDDPDAAYRLNRDAPAAMARACAARGLPLVHVSTDYVFDGKGGAPYAETDPVSPTGVYGASKAAGEIAVRAAGGRAVSIRTSWVYAAEGSNFVNTMLRLARDRPEVAVVADQRGRPTWARDLAEGVLRAADGLEEGRLGEAPILHMAGGGEASWAELAQAVFAGARRHGAPAASVKPIPTEAYPTRAVRPPDSRLDLSLAESLLNWKPRPWREALGLCLDEALGAAH